MLIDTMVTEIQERLPEQHYPLRILQTINKYLYDDLGFTGNKKDYYDPRNSFLNDVIERRSGIPNYPIVTLLRNCPKAGVSPW